MGAHPKPKRPDTLCPYTTLCLADRAAGGVPPIGRPRRAAGDLDTVHIEKSGKRREWSRLIHAVGVQRDAAFGAGRNDGETDATNGNHTGTSARRNVEVRDRRLDVDQICDRRREFRFWRSEEHTSEPQSLMRISYAV